MHGGSWRYDVVTPGFKYNMTDIAAALGLAQLERFAEMQARRAALAARYLDGLEHIRSVEPVAHRLGTDDEHSWCVFPVAVTAGAGIERDALIAALNAANIGTSMHYIPTHLFGAYRGFARGPLPVTEAVWQRLISLPLYPSMLDSDVDDVLAALSAIDAAAHKAATP